MSSVLQVIFKCCKLIPVLIGGILIQGKRYGLMDFTAAAFMCLGLIFFTLADSKVGIRILMYIGAQKDDPLRNLNTKCK